ncbi:MAG: class I SAM-dependent methyltransferase [Alphaproteobacteria bacterium]|nr:class I SAM-dependent methyltransferase [Alphaproteobacteria bacterium]
MNRRALFLKVLSGIRYGELDLVTPDGATHRFRGDHPGEKANVALKDWAVIGSLFAAGDIGLGETYMDGLWEADDLRALLTLCQRNREVLEKVRGLRLLTAVKSWIAHQRSRNTLAGSKKNMAASYDYPPALFRTFTDKMMTYSGAWWGGQEMSYDDAQLNKYNRILEKIGPPPQHILEMGCGWGYFLQLAAARGYRVTGCTVSRQQYEYGRELNRDAIAAGQVSLFFEDYRRMPGQYDAVMSTGFFEHVGSDFWVEHFRKIKQYLKPDGVCMIQTMLTNKFDQNQGRRLNFNTKYIFPGGEFPSIGTFIVAAEEAGLKCEDHLVFGQDYARTMSECWNNFHNSLADVRALGFDAKFIRKWEFFLAGWYSMFKSGNYNVMQAKLVHYP